MYIQRKLEEIIKKDFNKGKILVLYGARQVGKTTLVNRLLADFQDALFFSCDEEQVRARISADVLPLKALFGTSRFVVFDEMQYLKNPGLVLKIIADNFPQMTVIATGSSAFDLANKLNEPLTGRHYKFQLYPFSYSEIYEQSARIEMDFIVRQNLVYGTYPGVFSTVSNEEKARALMALTDSYLYKDILSFGLVRDSRKVRELLVALALQVGNEVSYNELATKLGIGRQTVERYLDLLEKSFVLFRLYGFSRNLRSEINRKVKIYFYDNGVRNALINNFNSLDLRNDAGALFENYVVSEIMKKNELETQKANFYFWRTYDQKEIDLIKERNAQISAFEIKLSEPKKKISAKTFLKEYPGSTFEVISMDNLDKFLL